MIRRLSVLVMSTGLGLALVLAPSASSAEDEAQPNPVEQVIKTVQDVVSPKNVQTADHADAPDPPASDDDIPSNETVNPVGPDHGSTRGLNIKLGGQDVLGLNHDNATINDDGSATADSTLLSLGGSEVIGTHADSTGDSEDTFNPLAPLCAGTEGQLCAELLYSESYATNDGTTSSSTARSGIINACLGGTDIDQTNGCDGPVGAGVFTSDAHAERDLASGQTQATAETQAVGLCLQPEGDSCALGASLIESEGSADSGGADPSATRDSQVLGLEGGGESHPIITDPTDFSLPPGCPIPSLACLFFNQGETYLGPGLAGTAQDAILLSVLVTEQFPPLAEVGVGHTETLVHNPDGDDPDGDDPDGDDPDGDDPDGDDPDGDDPDGDDPDGDDPDGDDPDGDDSDERSDADEGDDRALPGTGGPSAALLALGMLGIGLGSGIIAYGRRPRKTGAN